uniref:MinD/ParA family ATP-binding protein n=1 Tax=Nonomuraea pusilla TaxID=46177 RepID=UPI001F473D3F|nr:MinD/ParA family protein [Nonomuraea pusilla]
MSEGSATVGRLPGSPGDGARSAFQPQADDRRTPLDTPAPKGGAAFETAGSEGGAAFETAGPEGREAPGAAGGRSAPGAAGGADGRTAPDAAEDPAAFDAVEGRAAFDAAAREAQEAFEAAARERRGKFGTEAGEGRAASDVLGPEGTGTFEDSGAEGPGAFGDFGSEGPGAFGDSGSEGRGAFAGSASEGAGTFWGSASEGTGTFGAGGSGDGGVPEWRPADRRVLPQPDTQPQQPSLPDVGRLGPHGHQPDLQDGGRAHGHQPGLQDGGPGHGQQSESGLLDGGRVHGRHAVQGGEVSPQGRASTGRASFEEREERGEQGQASGVGRRRAAPVPVFAAPPRAPVAGRPNADSLDPESLLRGRRNAPSKGWRRLVYKASGGWIKPGEPPEVRRRRELLTRARTPVTTGHHRVAVLSLKGGVGKTTTTVGLGATLAQVRGDRVIAVDANPDRGTLSDKLVLETSATVRDLLTERNQVKRYVDIRAFTSQAPSRLEVLASDRDPSVSEAFSGADYQAVSQVLENFYSICITDCGTGLLHSAMGGVLGLADQIVLVSSPSVDGARAASATLDWLEAHHYGDLVRNATVVLCSVRPRSKSAVDISKLEAHFAARCRAVIRVPYDPHLEEGAEIDLDRLQEATRDAYLQLAACVGDGFAGTRE